MEIAFLMVLALALLVWGIYSLVRPGARLGHAVAGLLSVAAGGVMLILLAVPALAADGAQVYAVSIPPDLVASVIDVAILALSALGSWLIKRGADWLKLDHESKLVERLELAMLPALTFARERLLAQGKDLSKVEVRSELVGVAATYLLPKMPGVLRNLGIDAEGLRERLTGRLDLVAPLPGQDTVNSAQIRE
ncbi:MAG TPA: hypothetical protein VD995_02765 [Azospirillum sp.]|nr:hypothetical protein [Azospirillum sp.]